MNSVDPRIIATTSRMSFAGRSSPRESSDVYAYRKSLGVDRDRGGDLVATQFFGILYDGSRVSHGAMPRAIRASTLS